MELPFMLSNIGDKDITRSSPENSLTPLQEPINKGFTPLMDAALEGDEAKVAELLKKKPELLEARDSSGNTALMYAVGGGHEAVVKQLLEAKADPNTHDDEGFTALMRAAQGEH